MTTLIQQRSTNLPAPTLTFGLLLVVSLLALIGVWHDSNAAHPVRVVQVTEPVVQPLRLIGEVVPRETVPIAFQIDGQIAERYVESGNPVIAGAVMFRLDDRDLREAVSAADAEVAAAEIGLDVTVAERERDAELLEQNFISRQALERSTLGVREARTRLDSARAALTRARNALDYASLVAPVDGLLLTVHAEVGQVVDAGEPLGVLASAGAQDVDVLIPTVRATPQAGIIRLDNGEEWPVRFRRQDGTADTATRQWPTRYTIDADVRLPFGELVEVILQGVPPAPDTLQVPVSVIDERGAGAQVWAVDAGVATPRAVQIVAIRGDAAVIRSADIAVDDTVIDGGTHLLLPGMAVRIVSPATASPDTAPISQADRQ